MQVTELGAKVREGKGKSACRKLRNAGEIPAVLYGKDFEPVSLSINEAEIEKVFRTRLATNTLLKINIDNGTSALAVFKDVQGQAISRRLTHLDFHVVKEDQVVEFKVPTVLKGRAVGVVQGGNLEFLARDVYVKFPVGHCPEEIVVDISNLKMGESIHLQDLDLGGNASFRNAYNPSIVAISSAKRGAAAAAAPAAGGDAAPAEEAKPAA